MIFSQESGSLEFILSEKISDHKPVQVENLLAWNILCMGRVSNNGFRIDETEGHSLAYPARLRKIAFLINQWVNQDSGIEIICLQEAPYLAEYLSIFLETLDNERFNKKTAVLTKTGTHNFQNLTLYSKQYTAIDVTQELAVSHSCQENRYHILELIHNKTGLQRRIGNVHFEWFPKEKMELRLATHEIIKELMVKYNCSLAGDFNQSLFWIREDEMMKQKIKAFYYPQNNNITFLAQTKRESKIGYGQIDAVIFV